jgi:hypothetical protein
VYSDNTEAVISGGDFRMYVAEIQYEGGSFCAKNIECLSSFEGNDKKRREKNWVPFEYEQKLLLAYSLVPHKIFTPVFGTGHCDTVVSSTSAIEWEWGELRGGTAALLDEGNYLSFFHSSQKIATVHSHGKEIFHYFMGAYTFAPTMPFNITHISPEPIVGKRFYEGATYKPYWKPVQVVFPCGFIADDNYIWVTYGRQDHEMWVTTLDKRKLYASLVPVYLMMPMQQSSPIAKTTAV